MLVELGDMMAERFDKQRNSLGANRRKTCVMIGAIGNHFAEARTFLCGDLSNIWCWCGLHGKGGKAIGEYRNFIVIDRDITWLICLAHGAERTIGGARQMGA